MKKYNAMLVGCGSIGALKPDKFDSPDTKEILTLAHAFYEHERISLDGFIDSDINKSQESMEKWYGKEIPIFTSDSIDSMLKIQSIDIVAIAVPTEYHMEVFHEVMMKINPKIILMEKPAGLNSFELLSIKNHGKTDRTKVGVDYIRRYAKGIQELKSLLDKLEVYNCVTYYNRGLKRDGCHAIDLMRYLFGKEMKIKYLDGQIHYDLSKDDPTVPLQLFPHNYFMLPVDGREVSCFETHIITNNGMYMLKENGLILEHYGKEPSKYGNYLCLAPKPRHAGFTGLDTALLNYVDEAVQILDGNRDEFSCTLDDALAVHKIIEGV